MAAESLWFGEAAIRVSVASSLDSGTETAYGLRNFGSEDQTNMRRERDINVIESKQRRDETRLEVEFLRWLFNPAALTSIPGIWGAWKVEGCL